jgi:hypothetical protein
MTVYALAAVCRLSFSAVFLDFPDRRLTRPAEAGISGVDSCAS